MLAPTRVDMSTGGIEEPPGSALCRSKGIDERWSKHDDLPCQIIDGRVTRCESYRTPLCPEQPVCEILFVPRTKRDTLPAGDLHGRPGRLSRS
jgi:hypothetical protein